MLNRERTIQVSKAKLLSCAIANREKHKDDVVKALSGWQIMVQEQLTQILEQIEQDPQSVDLSKVIYDLQKPENHIEDYDVMIGMLDWETRDTVEITITDYQNIVLDKWDWKNTWMISNSKYISK